MIKELSAPKEKDKNPPPLILPSPPDTSNSNSTSSFFEFTMRNVYGFWLQNSDAVFVNELWFVCCHQMCLYAVFVTLIVTFVSIAQQSIIVVLCVDYDNDFRAR